MLHIWRFFRSEKLCSTPFSRDDDGGLSRSDDGDLDDGPLAPQWQLQLCHQQEEQHTQLEVLRAGPLPQNYILE